MLCVDSLIGGVVGGVASLPSSAQVSKQLLQVFDASFTIIKAVWSRFSNLRNGDCHTIIMIKLCYFHCCFFLTEQFRFESC